jgi:hypothetical protein
MPVERRVFQLEAVHAPPDRTDPTGIALSSGSNEDDRVSFIYPAALMEQVKF